MWARFLLPARTILFLFTTIRSIDKTMIKTPRTNRDTPLVEVNGETNAADEPVAMLTCSGEAVGVGVGIAVGVGVGVGLIGAGVAEVFVVTP